jgi:predicted MFS family arabinose efflux permease
MNLKNILLILGLAGFIVMADNWVVSPILPAIANDLGSNVARASLIISAYMIPFGLFQLVFGYLADRFGKRQVISFSMVFFIISTALCATAAGITDLAVYRVLTGIFAACVMPVSLALIGDLFPINERQSAIGTFMGISFLGQGLSMAIGGSIAFFLNWRGVFIIYSLLSLIPTILLFTVGKKIPSSKNPDSKMFALYLSLVKNPSTSMIYLLVLLEGIFLMGTFSFLGGFIAKQFNYNNFFIGLIMTAFGVMAVVGGRVSGRISARIGKKKTIITGILLAVIANVLFAATGKILVFVVIGIGLMGLGFMLAHSTFLTIATEFAAKARGVAMSLVAFCFMGGGGLGTALGSRIVGSLGMNILFTVYGLGLILVAIGVLFNKRSFVMEN